MCGCLLHAPYLGPGLQPRHVPWLGIEPATLWFAGQCSTHWARVWNFSFLVNPREVKAPFINIFDIGDRPPFGLDFLNSEGSLAVPCSGITWGQNSADLYRWLSWNGPKYIQIVWFCDVAKCKQWLLQSHWLKTGFENCVKLCRNPKVGTSHHLVTLAWVL